MEPLWRIELFGWLRAERIASPGSQPVSHFRSQRTGALLAYLALYRQRAHPREILTDLFWPESSPEAGRHSLSVALCSLRGQFEPPGVSPGSVLVADRFAVRLDPARCATDVADFEGAAPAAKDGEGPERLRRLAAAAALYRGELLPGYYESWVLAERERLKATYLSLLAALVRQLDGVGETDRAREYAHLAVAADPLDEAWRQNLMRLSAACGQPSAAVRQFHDFERLAGTELGAAPEAATRALAREAASRCAPGTPDSSTGGPPGPQVPQGGFAGRLPRQRSRFFGRDAELDRLCRFVTQERVRLITLTGPGGTGKTRLAVEAAGRVEEALRGAVWFVPLADVRDPLQLPGALADALGLERLPGVDPLRQALAVLGGQPSLLVLDNFEQLLDGGPDTLRGLLGAAPELVCLVTSRVRLGLPGERPVRVDPLPIPPAVAAPEVLFRAPSVQLFIDRARAVSPGFQLTARNATAVAALCQQLEGIPLALELAAAWSPALTPAQMLARLARRLDFLAARTRAPKDRHDSLRAAIDWSYDLLSPELRRLFTRLSVFRGGWTAQAAERVAAAPVGIELLDELAQLEECSLVRSEAPGGPAGELRFSMLETLREYGAERLSPADRAALSQRHADYYVQLAETGERHLGGLRQGAWAERLTVEYDNFRAALDGCAARAAGDAAAAEAGLRLAAALGWFWRQRGRHTEGRTWLDRFLALAVEPTLPRARALHGAAQLSRVQEDAAAALALCEAALAIFRDRGDPAGRAGALHLFAMLARDRGEYAAARASLEESLEIHRAAGDDAGEAAAVHLLGMVAYAVGETDLARSHLNAALRLRRRLRDRGGIASALHALGDVALLRGEPEAAQALHEEALLIRGELRNSLSAAWSSNRLGAVAAARGDTAAARAHHAASLAVFRDAGDRLRVAGALRDAADLALREGCPERAARLTGAAHALWDALQVCRSPAERPADEAHRRALREALGEAAIAAAWEAGRGLAWEAAVAEALREPRDDSVIVPQ